MGTQSLRGTHRSTRPHCFALWPSSPGCFRVSESKILLSLSEELSLLYRIRLPGGFFCSILVEASGREKEIQEFAVGLICEANQEKCWFYLFFILDYQCGYLVSC